MCQQKVKCGCCGMMLDELSDIAIEERKPCPNCGSLSRFFNVEISEHMTIREKIGMKLKSPGDRKPKFESVSGEDLHQKTGKWNKIERRIDRDNNKYMEKIVDPTTGEIIHLCDEPLTEHQNRGSAKNKTNDDNSR